MIIEVYEIKFELLNEEIKKKKHEYISKCGRYPNTIILWEGYCYVFDSQYRYVDFNIGDITLIEGMNVIKCKDLFKMELIEVS